MLKEKIELDRFKNHISGYGSMNIPHSDSPEILNKLIEWSKNKDVKIYKHFISTTEENIDYFGPKYEFRSNNCPPANIPYCDLVVYLEIYYQ